MRGHEFIQINFGCCCCSFKRLTSPEQDFGLCFTSTFMVAFECRGVKLDYKALAYCSVVMRTTGFKEKPQLSLTLPPKQPAACVSVRTANQMTAGINLQAFHSYIYIELLETAQLQCTRRELCC